MPKGEGVVLPAGSLPPSGALPDKGDLIVTIDGFDDSGHVRCIYPDGHIKHHHAESIEELLPKVSNQIKGRYGKTSVNFTSTPKALTEGATIKIARA